MTSHVLRGTASGAAALPDLSSRPKNFHRHGGEVSCVTSWRCPFSSSPHPSRKTIGLRIPENPIALALLEDLGQPLLSTTLILSDDEHPLNDPEEIRDRIERQLELIIDGGACGLEPTSVVDLTDDEPQLVRQGRGDVGIFGL